MKSRNWKIHAKPTMDQRYINSGKSLVSFKQIKNGKT